jgi:CRP/FNR family transcriptional regulator, cyclic AMP receptor protein
VPNRFRLVAPARRRIIRRVAKAPNPYGLEIIESCLSCPHREDRLFCNLSPGAVERLAAITSPASYPQGATLFVEGQMPRGVFIVCDGHVKLSTSSSDGKTLILKIAEPGDVLGLPATVSGRPYEVTAEVLDPVQTNFIARQNFLSFLHDHSDAAVRVAEQLSETYQSAFAEMRTIGLSHSAEEKFARFLLDWSSDHVRERGPVKLKLPLTHEEIAQMIGASRETVTRLFAELKRRRILQVKGSTLVIADRAELEKLVGS